MFHVKQMLMNLKNFTGSKELRIFAVLKIKTDNNMKKNTKKEVYNLVNTFATQFEYSEYLEYCELNGIEPAPENSTAYWEWCGEEARINYECDMDNLMYSKLNNRTFLIEGTLGLWWGKPTIYPVVVNGIVGAIKKCFGSCDDLDAELNTKDGVIYVNSHHHDGCNCFTIKMLNKNGERWADSVLERGDVIESNNRWWTKLKSIYDIWE